MLPESLKKAGYTLAGKLYERLSGEEVVPYDERNSMDEDGFKATDVKSASFHSTKQDPHKFDHAGQSFKKLARQGVVVVLVAAVALVAVSALTSSFKNRPVKIKLEQFIQVGEIYGLNGSAELSYGMDMDALKYVMFGDDVEATSSDAESVAQAEKVNALRNEAIAALEKSILLRADKDQELSNGDVVMIQTEYHAPSGFDLSMYNFIDGSIEYVVSDLTIGTEVDPFAKESMTISVSGLSGSAVAEVTPNSKTAYTYYLNYTWSPKSGLKNGDEVTITVSPDNAKLQERGYVVLPGNMSFTYTVEGLSEPVAEVEDIPESLVDEMVSVADGQLKKAYSALMVTDDDVINTEPQIISAYFVDKADKSNPYVDVFSDLEMVNGLIVLGNFSVSQAQGSGDSATTKEVGGYYCWIIPDIVKDTNGICVYRGDGITQKAYSYDNEQDVLRDLQRNLTGFNFTQVDFS